MRNPRLTCLLPLQAMALLICVPGPVLAESCFAPSRPFLPSDSQAARDYADIIRGDFEDYIQDIQSYFRCLDGEGVCSGWGQNDTLRPEIIWFSICIRL